MQLLNLLSRRQRRRHLKNSVSNSIVGLDFSGISKTSSSNMSVSAVSSSSTSSSVSAPSSPLCGSPGSICDGGGSVCNLAMMANISGSPPSRAMMMQQQQFHYRNTNYHPHHLHHHLDGGTLRSSSSMLIPDLHHYSVVPAPQPASYPPKTERLTLLNEEAIYRTLNFVKDQYDNIASHTNKSIDLLDKYGQFSRDLAAVEIDYAARLRRLAKNYQIKRKDEEDNMCTVIQAFNKSLKEITDIAGQHEIIAEELSLNIVKDIGTVLKELKDERKRHLQEGTRLQNALQHTISMLEKSKKNYEKAFRESEKAHENYQKADADLNLSRAEVEKARLISLSKSSMCDDAKSDYATHLQRTNELQRQHYMELMPRVFHQLQEMEERRSQCIKSYIYQCAQIRKKVMPIIEKCIDGIVDASEMIDPKEDSRLVIEKYKSGVEPPGDFPFEDLSNRHADDSISNGDSSDGASVHSNGGSGSHGSTKLHYSKSVCSGTLIGSGGKSVRLGSRGRRVPNLFSLFTSNKSGHDESKDDYSDLPPNQRRKRIQSKIDLIQNNIQQQNSVKEALLKMRQAFESNSKLGDPQSVNTEMVECEQQLTKLENELQKYQKMLAGVTAATPTASQKKSSSLFSPTTTSASHLTPPTANGKVGTNGHRNSISDNSNDSVSRSESETSLQNSNGSNGSYHAAGTNGNYTNSNGGAGSLMQAANSLLSKYAITASTPVINNANNTSPGATGAYKPVVGNGSVNGSKTSTPTTNGGYSFSNGKAKSDQDISASEDQTDHTTVNGDDDDGAPGTAAAATTDDEFDEPMAALGTAKALYDFEGHDEGSINMAEGEMFELIELDQGDGWTRVRRMAGDYEEGFVPTTYIESALYENGSSS